MNEELLESRRVVKNILSLGIKSQLLSSLYMLKDCIDRCPELEWDERHKDYPFSQVVFHTLFDCDINLSESEEKLLHQTFHAENRNEFGSYEELKGKNVTRTFSRSFILKYYNHCIDKLSLVLESKTNEELLIENTDYYKTMTKMERYINCIRHTQHHAAQLGLRLQFITREEMQWVGRNDK